MMTCKNFRGWRFAFAVVAVIATLSPLGFSAAGPVSQALPDDEPDFLVLNPEGE
jgi:hypothetical protein